jgi:hypothetical protein
MHRRYPECNSNTPRTIATIDAQTVVISDATPDAQFTIASCAGCGFVYALEISDDRFLERRKASLFDAILLSDVLEHVSEPRAILAQCRDLLIEKGWLAVSVPDFNPRRLKAVVDELRIGAKVTPELNPWEDLNYFSSDTLVQMVKGQGFDVDVMPIINFGLRKRVRGIRRIGHVIRSVARLLQFAISPSQGSTTVFAQRRS